MFCHRCGAQLGDADLFCHSCGAGRKPIQEETNAVITQSPRTEPTKAGAATNAPRKPVKKRGKWRIPVYCAAGVLFLFLLWFYILPGAPTPTAAAERFIVARRMHDYDAMSKYGYCDWEEVYRQRYEYYGYNMSFSEYWDEIQEEGESESRERYTDVDCEVTKVEKTKFSSLQYARYECLRNTGDTDEGNYFEEEDLDVVAEVSYQVTDIQDGKRQTIWHDTCWVARVNGRWYFLADG